ncbi:MAG TPA: Gfo/Idh/MocA family oxidoreductase, partial [Tabrizicola sp.]|nr:Gfo/Idh/MocA family oxidoreductase [Tabrizicola sp.]
MRVLVIGSGSIGRRHHDNLQWLGATSRLVSWREAGIGGALAAMTDAEAVVVATATDIRLPLIEAAAARGLPIYVEKPLAFRPEEVEQIASVAAPVADRSMLGLMLRYHPAARALATTDLSDVFQFAMTIGHDVTQWRGKRRPFHKHATPPPRGGGGRVPCHYPVLVAFPFPLSAG